MADDMDHAVAISAVGRECRGGGFLGVAQVTSKWRGLLPVTVINGPIRWSVVATTGAIVVVVFRKGRSYLPTIVMLHFTILVWCWQTKFDRGAVLPPKFSAPNASVFNWIVTGNAAHLFGRVEQWITPGSPGPMVRHRSVLRCYSRPPISDSPFSMAFRDSLGPVKLM